MFISLIFFGFLMSMSSQMWFTAWLGMELMGFYFMPYQFLSDCSFYNKISSWKYFTVQTIGSSIFLLVMQINMMTNTSPYIDKDLLFAFTVFLCMMLKLGNPPFHMWSFELSENLSWDKFFLLNVFMKSSPLFILWNISLPASAILVHYTCVICGFTLLSLYDLSFRHFLIYGSILNISWMCLSASCDLSSMLLFYLSYGLMMLSLLIISNKEMPFSNFSSINSITSGMDFFGRSSFLVIILSLMGFPPFLGFLNKFNVCMSLIKNGNFFFCIPLVIASILIMTIYLMICMSSFFVKKSSFCYDLGKKKLGLLELSLIFMNLFFFIFYFF